MSDDFDPTRVAWVQDDKDLAHLDEAIIDAIECVIDLETTGLDEHARRDGATNGGYPARIVLASLTLPSQEDQGDPTTWVVPLSHPDSPFAGRWREVIARIATTVLENRVPVVNQNMKFDARWVYAHTRVDLAKLIVWDTQIGSSLLDETTSTRLKERAPAVFDVPRWDDFDLSTPGAAERVPLFDLGLYAARDTYWTWRLAEYQRAEMFLHPSTAQDEPMTSDEVEGARLGQLATWVAMPSVASMTAVEQRGIFLDVEWVNERLASNEEAERALREKLVALYTPVDEEGNELSPSFAPTSNYFRGWTELAVEAGDLVVTSLTNTGKAQWSKEVLGRQARQGREVAALLLEHRTMTKQNEFLRSWLGYVTPFGSVHSTYNIGGAATGRLSSSAPNMQQVTKSLRPAYIPRPGYVIADFDLSQIELRVAAFLSRSVPLMQAFEDGLDLHTILASKITGKAMDDVTPDDRQKGKSANFGLLFAMGVQGFQIYAENAYGVVMTLEEAAIAHETFFTTWTGLREWQDRMRNRAHSIAQVTSPLGRVRRLPDIHSANDHLVGAAERIAINSPVQGMASDIMQLAIAIIEGTLPGSVAMQDVRIVGSVHDSLVAELPEGRWHELTERILWVMTQGVLEPMRALGCDFDVPLAAEATVGTRWSLDDVGRIAS